MRLMSKAQFARHIGRDKSWVTRAAQQGRIELEGSGRHARVKVEASELLLAASAGNRDDVAQRHAEHREEHRAAQSGAQVTAQDGAAAAGEAIGEASTLPLALPPDRDAAVSKEPADPTLVEARRAKILAESRRAQAAADREEMERDKEAGQLLTREAVDTALKFLGATLRGLLDVLPDQLAPVVAPVSDLDEVHALLAQAARDVLTRLGEAMERQREQLLRSAP